jgi:hypothetical protein
MRISLSDIGGSALTDSAIEVPKFNRYACFFETEFSILASIAKSAGIAIIIRLIAGSMNDNINMEGTIAGSVLSMFILTFTDPAIVLSMFILSFIDPAIVLSMFILSFIDSAMINMDRTIAGSMNDSINM